jgi:hypothetical protein
MEERRTKLSGDALMPGRVHYLRGASVAERLEYYSKPEPNSGCRLWLGRMDGVGYGMVWVGAGKSRGAHVMAWEIANGRSVPKDMCVCHHCDVRACVEPSHLFIGTKADNNADMTRKGRARRIGGPKGELHYYSKLTERDVLAIRADVRNPKVVASDYDVHWSVIYQVKQRRRWKHIPEATA